jgi:hypothetical protein
VVEQDIKFGVSAVAPKASMEASLRYLHGVIGRLNAGNIPNSTPAIRLRSDPSPR